MTPRNDKALLEQVIRTIRNAHKRGELTHEQIAALENAGFKFSSQLAKMPCTDHLGQHYPTQKAMCKAWGVDAAIYRGRIKSGWTLEEALTGIRKRKTGPKSCTDHLGQEFPSIRAMCKAWDVRISAYHHRIERGWTLEEALTGKRKRKTGPKPCKDHLGQEFPSTTAMCEAWGTNRGTYRDRIKYGWSLEEALTGNRESKSGPINCKDHLGRTYPSQKAMCEAWDVDAKLVHSRLKRGWSVEEALTDSRRCTDHLGNEYETSAAMCRHYNVNCNTYKNRLLRGWRVEEALTGNRKKGGDSR